MNKKPYSIEIWSRSRAWKILGNAASIQWAWEIADKMIVRGARVRIRNRNTGELFWVG